MAVSVKDAAIFVCAGLFAGERHAPPKYARPHENLNAPPVTGPLTFSKSSLNTDQPAQNTHNTRNALKTGTFALWNSSSPILPGC